MAAQARCERRDDAPLEGSMDDALIEDTAAEVGRLFGELHPLRNGRRRHEPGDAEPGHQSPLQLTGPAVYAVRPI